MSAPHHAGSPASKKRKISEADHHDATAADTLLAAAQRTSQLNIHPSRLNMAPALKKAAAKGTAASREKTKAKQRYLKAKKDRRKARKKAAPKGDKNKQQQQAAPLLHQHPLAFPEEAALERAAQEQDGSSDSDSESDSSSSSASSADQDEAPSTADKDVDGATPMTEDGGADEEKDATPEQSQGDESQPKTPDDEDDEVVGLQRFPEAGVQQAADPALIKQLGLPEGLCNRTVVDPTLSKPLSVAQDGAAAEGACESARSADFANVSLSESVRSRLEMLGVSEWFAVQVSVIPSLLSLPHSRSLYRPHAPPRDLCVSAPTGSGKTLAYSVPIVEVLRSRQVTRLRALIVLPTRDLVSQVKSTIELIAKGTGLRVGIATGQHSFAHEQAQIMNKDVNRPKVDILIATPGRLIDHLDSTMGFTLAHLRFLVIDEADRLLSQSFQEWLRKVLQATESSSSAAAVGTESDPLLDLDDRLGSGRFNNDAADAPFRALRQGRGDACDALDQVTSSVQKLLFSATLTQDPAKIAALGLRHPHYITIQSDSKDVTGPTHENFSLPQSLREHMLVTTAADKPLELLRLLHRPAAPIRRALCFTKSVESAARLVKLVQFFEEGRAAGGMPAITVRNFSSELKAGERQKIMGQFTKGEIDLLVCSDLISRGIDLPDVLHVISYDVPVNAAKYVHRVGRTARAHREGDAWTLVEEQEARYFKGLMKTVIRQGKLDKVKAKADANDAEMQQGYAAALRKLAEFYYRAGGEAAY
ncbi:ATP-dependent RNA helicase dbp6 [Thecaphora frezii]